ncbi:hypothetical protein [Paenibacillus odorifer]|uniref:hypothetical protein n=1 Tax=Paenibacillus odorifer TaxID=189426 RepID=UPI0015BD02C9|nr:hypothetical protein [Paenibacillus odorifer]
MKNRRIMPLILNIKNGHETFDIKRSLLIRCVGAFLFIHKGLYEVGTYEGLYAK